MSTDHLPARAERLPPPTLAERHEINELMRMVRSYTHPVLFNKRSCLGTAVLLRHGERLFAFTAAHNISDDTAIIFRMDSSSTRTQFEILSTYRHPNYDPDADVSKFDLAILELEPNPTISAGDISQLPASVGYSRLPAREHEVVGNTFVWVVGYPSELAIPSSGKHLYQTAFCTQIMDYSSDQLSLYYPEVAYQMPQDGISCELGQTTRTPEGYSGGGVWVTTNPAGDLFNPHRHIKLVGMQTHWSRSEKMLRCVPSKVMAESLNEFRPNLLASLA
jgi:hypothetical protein